MLESAYYLATDGNMAFFFHLCFSIIEFFFSVFLILSNMHTRIAASSTGFGICDVMSLLMVTQIALLCIIIILDDEKEKDSDVSFSFCF